MKCRSFDKQLWILDNYYVKPLLHLKLIPGQNKKHSDAGGYIKGSYYVFNLISKKQPRSYGKVICGEPTAKIFLTRSNKQALPLFDPLNLNLTKIDTLNLKNEKSKWNSEAWQLRNAIIWTFILLNEIDDASPLFKRLLEVERYYYHKPFDNAVKAINTIIYKCFKSSLTQIINKQIGLKMINPEYINFDQLKKHLNSINNINYPQSFV